MPATPKQKALAGADLGRKRAGKPTRTGMSEAQLKEMIASPTRAAKKKPPKKPKKPKLPGY